MVSSRLRMTILDRPSIITIHWIQTKEMRKLVVHVVGDLRWWMATSWHAVCTVSHCDHTILWSVPHETIEPTMRKGEITEAQ